MMYAIFPIGGYGNRFADSEFEEPKPFIDVHGKIQLEWSVLSCRKNYPEAKIILGSRRGLFSKCEDFAMRMSLKLNADISVVDVGENTRGAAHTVAIILQKTNSTMGDFEFIVLDNDLSVQFEAARIFQDCSAGVVITKSNNPSHSFVVRDSQNRVLKITEKKIISDTGVVGNYYFRSKNMFLNYYREIQVNNAEQFISDVIKVYLANNEIVSVENSSMVISYGTPSEVRTLTAESMAFLLS